MIAARALLFAACLLPAQEARKVVKITGEGHKLVLFSDGSVGGWGDIRDGQLGPRAEIPSVSDRSKAFVKLSVPGRVLDVAAGARTTYLLLEDGTVWAMGWGIDGELGCAEPCPKPSEKLTPVAGVREATQLAASGKVAFAVHRDGSVTQWGDGAKNAPGKVNGVSAVTQLSAGGGHVLARTSRGSVLAWGKLAIGRIYYDDPVKPPHEVPGLSGVVSVTATGVAAALKDDGTVWVWGNNQQAQFGNGRRDVDDQSRVPIRVPGVSDVTALSGAELGRHFLALRKDGTVVAWGNTDWGQVGNGVSGREQSTPVALRISRVQSVFAAGNNSFALLRDGSLRMWGAGADYPGEWPLPKNAKLPVVLDFASGVTPAVQ